jgi:hypothetical protein
VKNQGRYRIALYIADTESGGQSHLSTGTRYNADFLVRRGSKLLAGIVWDISTRDGILTWVGTIGTTLSIILYLASKSFLADDTEATIGDKLNSLDETLTHAASETAFVTFWVLSAYLYSRLLCL